MAFLETPTFPRSVAEGASGGPQYSTNVVVVASGKEHRNATWTYPRHTYDVGYIQRMTDLEDLIAFFHVTQGMLDSFRFRDYADYKSCKVGETPTSTDQVIDTGDAIETEFQLIKTYTQGSTKTRLIQKPIDGTLLVAVDGSLQTETTHYTVDYTTGIITFVSAPGDTLDITAGYEFDVPCRFDTDQLQTNIDYYAAGEISVPLIEVKI